MGLELLMPQGCGRSGADNPMVWLLCGMYSEMEGASAHPAQVPPCRCPRMGGTSGGIFAPRRADGRACPQVQPVACENSEDRSITRVDEGLEDFFAKRVITEELP